jgi:hypothetical protein
MKCWNLIFDVEGLRVIIVVLRVKIYVVAMEAFKKKGNHDEIMFTKKLMIF